MVDPFQMANAGNADAFVTNISTPITVPGPACTFTAMGCNPTLGQQIVLPEGLDPPAGSTITQAVMQVDDPGFVNGQCDGVTQKFLLNGTVPVPGYICGGEDGFTLLIT